MRDDPVEFFSKFQLNLPAKNENWLLLLINLTIYFGIYWFSIKLCIKTFFWKVTIFLNISASTFRILFFRVDHKEHKSKCTTIKTSLYFNHEIKILTSKHNSRNKKKSNGLIKQQKHRKSFPIDSDKSLFFWAPFNYQFFFCVSRIKLFSGILHVCLNDWWKFYLFELSVGFRI